MSSFSQEIVDAYCYHEMVAELNDVKEPKYWESRDFFDREQEDYKLTRPYKVSHLGNQEDINHYRKQPPFLLDPKDELTVSISTPNGRNEHECSNSTLRPDMQKTYSARTKRHSDLDYLVDEGYLKGLEVIGPNAGFLMQLSHICVESKLRDCHNKACVQQRKAMDKIAPACDWQGFRNWALVAMSCQEMLSHEQKLTRAHTHVSRSVLDCVSLLKGGIGWNPYSRWDQDFFPLRVNLLQIEEAARKVPSLAICPYGIWNMVALSARKQVDLPDIVDAFKSSATLRQEGHDYCTPTKCQRAQMNGTLVQQLHKCSNSGVCLQATFPVDLLALSIEHGHGSAWLLDTPLLSMSGDPYIAISHVWSDGTGIGLKAVGTVNDCLFNYFARVASTLQCTAVWWDTLSIPIERKARVKALNDLHNNYARAECTIVHDQYLLNTEWTDDGTPCLALVLSPWFTRGWTALELAMSKSVKVLYKGPNANTPVIKDLDREILASGPGRASRAHWLASTLIRRLRQPVRGVGDLLAILRPRSTSFMRDRTIISGLLAGVPDCDYSRTETEITRDILIHMGNIPHTSLLHGHATMCDSGPFSWSAATLDDMPVETSMADEGRLELKRNTVVDVDQDGAVVGLWYYRQVRRVDQLRGRLVPQAQSLAALLKINCTLRRWQNCLLIRQYRSDEGPALLVATVGVGGDDEAACSVIDCRYVGVVREISSKYSQQGPVMGGRRRRYGGGSNPNEPSVWKRTIIRLGKENGRPDMRASKTLKLHQSQLAGVESEEDEYKKPPTLAKQMEIYHNEPSGDLDKDFDEDFDEDTDEDASDSEREADENVRRRSDSYEDAGRYALRERDTSEDFDRAFDGDTDEDASRDAERYSEEEFDEVSDEDEWPEWEVRWEGVKKYKRRDITEEIKYGQEEMVSDSNETKARHLFLAVHAGNMEAARHLIHSGVNMTAESKRELTVALGAERLSAFLQV